MVIGQQVADLERFHIARDTELTVLRQLGKLGRRAELFDLIDPRVVAGNDDAEGNGIARLEITQLVGAFNIERHGHRGHVVRHFLVFDDNAPGFGLDLLNDALGLVIFSVGVDRRRSRGAGRRRGFPPAGREHASQPGEQQQNCPTRHGCELRSI